MWRGAEVNTIFHLPSPPLPFCSFFKQPLYHTNTKASQNPHPTATSHTHNQQLRIHTLTATIPQTGKSHLWTQPIINHTHNWARSPRCRNSLLTTPYRPLLTHHPASLACWQILIRWRPSSLYRWWCDAAPAWLRRFCLYPHNPPQRWDPECPCSNVATTVWSCPDHQHPTTKQKPPW